MKSIVLTISALLIQMHVSAYAEEKKESPKVITLQIARHGQSPYAETAPGAELKTINAAVLGRLLSQDEGLDVVPNLLEEAFFDYKKQAYILKLRQNLTFHNGRLVTSRDLEFALLRGFFSKNRSFYSTYVGNIFGIEAAVGRQYTSGLVRGVKIIDPLSVEVRLKNPNPSFLHSLTNPYFSLVPQEELTESLLSWKRFPVGVGPYKIVEPGFKDGKLTLKKSDSVAKGPEIVEIYSKDIAPQYDISLVSNEKVKNATLVLSNFPSGVTSLYFSRLNPLGANIHFRKALAALVDREKLISGYEGYNPTDQVLPRHFWGRAPTVETRNIEIAKAEIAKVPSEHLREFRYQVFAGANKTAELERMLSELESQFRSIGLAPIRENTVEKFTSEATAKRIAIDISTIISDYVDPLVMFSVFRPTGHDPYLAPVNDKVFEELYEAASRVQLKEDRVTSVQKLSKHVSENLLSIPLLERKNPVYINGDAVKSLGNENHPVGLLIENIVAKR